MCDKYTTLFSYFINAQNQLLRPMIYSFFKNAFFVINFLFLLTTLTLSEISTKEWSEQCNESKTECLIGVKSEITLKDKNQQTLASAFIFIGSSKQKIMNLINKNDQTYKLSEENKNIPILIVKLPLNVDLRKKPAVVIDDKKLGDLNFTHCNKIDGCVTNVIITDEVIELFKKGKTMNVVIGIYGTPKNMKLAFPLKNFTKSYTKMTKK